MEFHKELIIMIFQCAFWRIFRRNYCKILRKTCWRNPKRKFGEIPKTILEGVFWSNFWKIQEQKSQKKLGNPKRNSRRNPKKIFFGNMSEGTVKIYQKIFRRNPKKNLWSNLRKNSWRKKLRYSVDTL